MPAKRTTSRPTGGRLALWAGLLFTLSASRAPAAIVLRAAGDVIVHNTQLAAARDPRTGTYSFRSSFAPIAPVLRGCDLALCNLETVLAGPASGYTGFPKFNSPVDVARALQWAGCGLLGTANNHCLDRGRDGLLSTIAKLDRIGLRHAGTYASRAARATPLVLSLGDGRLGQVVRVGVVACTYGTNGLPAPQPWLISRYDPQQLAADVAAARAAAAEVVVALVHWGVEYRRRPSDEQRRQAATMAAAGVDIIFGSHPHVAQPIEWLDAGGGRRTLCYWSLGNFIADQKLAHTNEGLIADVALDRDAAGRLRITRAGFIPTFIDRFDDRGRRRFRVLAVEAARDKDVSRKRLAGPLKAAWDNLTRLCERAEDGIRVTHVE